MSISSNINNIPYSIREKIVKDLRIRKKKNEYTYASAVSWVNPFNIVENDVYLPFAYALSLKTKEITRPKNFPKANINFIGKLRDYQEEVRDKEFLPTLNKNFSVILATFPGWGKTTFSIYISSLISLKTAIISHRKILLKQWEESIERLIKNPKIQIVDSHSLLDPDANFYIISAHIIEKLGYVFKNIGLVIVDEVHCIATETLYKSLFYFTPRFLIGLSATPTRPDGMDVLLDLYFGTERISRKVKRNHYIFKILTKIQPKIEKSKTGTTDWNVLLNSLAENDKKNEMIINIVQNVSKLYTKRTFLILTKRVEHAKLIMSKLNELGITTTYLFGNKNDYDSSAKVLIATVSKVGLGFDHPNLSVLILGSDVEEYFVQYLGRVLYRSKFTPWVFDLVDDYSSLLSHFYTRRKVYLECGGAIVKCPNPNNKKDFLECVKSIHR